MRLDILELRNENERCAVIAIGKYSRRRSSLLRAFVRQLHFGRVQFTLHGIDHRLESKGSRTTFSHSCTSMQISCHSLSITIVDTIFLILNERVRSDRNRSFQLLTSVSARRLSYSICMSDVCKCFARSSSFIECPSTRASFVYSAAQIIPTDSLHRTHLQQSHLIRCLSFEVLVI